MLMSRAAGNETLARQLTLLRNQAALFWGQSLDRASLEESLSCSAIGSPATVKASVESFVERTGADELIIASQIYDQAAQLRSFEMLAQLFRQRAPAGPVGMGAGVESQAATEV